MRKQSKGCLWKLSVEKHKKKHTNSMRTHKTMWYERESVGNEMPSKPDKMGIVGIYCYMSGQ